MTAQAPVWTAVCVWALLGAHASWTDLRYSIVSRQACWLAGSVIAVLWAASALALGEPLRLIRTFIGSAAVAAATEVADRRRPDAIGYGDIRLIIVNSLLVSWWGIAWPWWALTAGAIAASPRALISRLHRGREASIRCAPALAVGTGVIAAALLAAHGPVP
ncbi:prepilin peptidase [Candidatus Poriferisodalis sp.]|uniref:prepilin peptidase n=1 Tax=Candidatus Poriferisodalis sp. TaxID=3101277 RepID=UPI003B52C5F0